MKSAVATLTVRLSKRTDGNAVLRCVRADGSETWQKQEGTHAAFFPRHDLTHFAVETVLGVSNGFYGLIAGGWDIEETTGKTPRGALPAEALFVENVVGTFDSERAGSTIWTAEEFNYAAELYASNSGRPTPRKLTDDELRLVRKRRAELFAQWSELPAGQTLELAFP